MKWEAAGAPPARWPAIAPPCRSFHFIFLKIFIPKVPSSSPLSYSHNDFFKKTNKTPRSSFLWFGFEREKLPSSFSVVLVLDCVLIRFPLSLCSPSRFRFLCCCCWNRFEFVLLGSDLFWVCVAGFVVWLCGLWDCLW